MNNMEFEKLSENSYVLKSNEETHKKYPYEFELYISHEVQKNKVITTICFSSYNFTFFIYSLPNIFECLVQDLRKC